MFSKRHEQELADIKAKTQELGERLQMILERLDRIAQDRNGEPAGQVPGTQDASTDAAVADEPEDATERRGHRARAGATEGRSPERKGKKAAKRARAAEAAAGTAATPDDAGGRPKKAR